MVLKTWKQEGIGLSAENQNSLDTGRWGKERQGRLLRKAQEETTVSVSKKGIPTTYKRIDGKKKIDTG